MISGRKRPQRDRKFYSEVSMINYCGAWGRPLGCGGGSDGSLRILEVGQSFWARNLEWGAMGASKACATPGIAPHLPTTHSRCSVASEMSM